VVCGFTIYLPGACRPMRMTSKDLLAAVRRS
jgi:hypothetical protein